MVAAYELLIEIVRTLFDAVCAQGHFADMVAVLVRFAQSPANARVSTDAVALVQRCVERALPRLPAGGRSAAALGTWFPVLTGLCSVVAAHPGEAVRAAALRALCGLLRAHGGAFGAPVWALVFRGALLPMFDAVGYCRGALADAADPEWLRTTCAPALDALFALVRTFRARVVPAVLPELLALLRAFVAQGGADLVRHGAACFAALVADCVPVLEGGAWGAVADALRAMLEGAGVRTAVQLVAATSSFSIKHSSSSSTTRTVEGGEDDQDKKEGKEEEGQRTQQVHCAYCGKALEAQEEEDESACWRCPLCDDAVYCSAVCQRAHWGVHRSGCLRAWTPSAAAATGLRCVVLTPREDFAVARMPNSPGSRALATVRLSPALVRARCAAVETLLHVLEAHPVLLQHAQQQQQHAVLNTLAACATAGGALLAGARARSLLGEWDVLAAVEAAQGRVLARCVGALHAEYAATRSAAAEARFFALCADVLAALGDADTGDVLATVLETLLALDEPCYTAHVRRLYAALAALIDCSEPRVRALVRKHFVRIGQAFHLSDT